MDFTVTIGGSVALSLVALSSIPAIKSISQRLRTARYEPIDVAKDVYRDEDGEATKESIRAFSDKWQRSAIALFSMTGFLATLALAVLTTLEANVSKTLVLVWLQFAAWVRTSNQEIPQRPALMKTSRSCSRSKPFHFSQNLDQRSGLHSALLLPSEALSLAQSQRSK